MHCRNVEAVGAEGNNKHLPGVIILFCPSNKGQTSSALQWNSFTGSTFSILFFIYRGEYCFLKTATEVTLFVCPNKVSYDESPEQLCATFFVLLFSRGNDIIPFVQIFISLSQGLGGDLFYRDLKLFLSCYLREMEEGKAMHERTGLPYYNCFCAKHCLLPLLCRIQHGSRGNACLMMSPNKHSKPTTAMTLFLKLLLLFINHHH